MASNASTAEVAEQAKLVETEEEDANVRRVEHSAVRHSRRLILGAVLSAALAAGVLWKAFAPCVEVDGISDGSASSLVVLSDQYPEDLQDLLDGRHDAEARENWLAAARTVASAKAEKQSAEAAARTRETVRRAMEVSDPAEADKIVRRAMVRAVQKSKLKRRELKKLIHGPRHFLKGDKKPKKEVPTTTDAPKAMKDHSAKEDHSPKADHSSKEEHSPKVDHSSKEDHSTKAGHSSKEDHQKSQNAKKASTTKNPLFHMMSKGFGMGGSRDTTTTEGPGTNPMGVKNAQCVFDVLSVTNSLAALASNINDASKTCKYVKVEELIVYNEHGPEAVHTRVCSVNVLAVLGGLLGIAGTLSAAADSCSSTLVPNVDAKCATAVMGMVQAVAQTGGAFTLISAACRDEGWYEDIPEDRFPSNVGSNALFDRDFAAKQAGGRLLAESSDPLGGESSASAPPRQLLFGGGKGSTATQCATEIGSVMWSLANAGLAINSAGNVNGPACPPANLWGEEDPKLKGIVYKVSQGLCAVDIESALTSFLSVIAVLQLVAVNCVDTLNVKAICGAGITGIFAGSAGLSQAATGVWLACDELQDQPLKGLIEAVRGIDSKTGLITNVITGDIDLNFGRRLAEERSKVEELKRRFKTPEEVWMSIGYDLHNASAAFRKVGFPEPDMQAISSLVEEPEAMKDGVAGLFGSQSTCSN